jgi:hypothetical protein
MLDAIASAVLLALTGIGCIYLTLESFVLWARRPGPRAQTPPPGVPGRGGENPALASSPEHRGTQQ